MFNSLVEKILPKTEDLPKIQDSKVGQNQIIDKFNTDASLEELKKTLNTFEIEPIPDLPESHVSTLREHKSAVSCVSYTRIKVINLFRLGSRLYKQERNKKLYEFFENSLAENWKFLSSTEKSEMERLHLDLKDKYSNSLNSEKNQLFGAKVDSSDIDFFSHTDLQKQILDLAKNMKQVAKGFSSTLESDNSLLETIYSKQSTYLTELNKEHEKMDSIQIKTSMWANFKAFVAVIFSLIIFITMMVIIYLFPSTSYIYLNNH
ncbi:hypothetical protein SteCoe_37276 [Stentor coeruleus]|uniref:Uncharacterized protein n=1 Tax=Stentor coeruleus TaxID=5963 RepID=A0A1R2ANP5_9CILI|nr:hypothetical protein SteCoe_37276 [Stentor coeruleus]